MSNRSKIFDHSDSTPRAGATVLVKARTRDDAGTHPEDRLVRTKRQKLYSVPPGTRLHLAAHLEIDGGGHIDTQRMLIALEAAAPIFFKKWFEHGPGYKRSMWKKTKKGWKKS